jgi:hypothetical protein
MSTTSNTSAAALRSKSSLEPSAFAAATGDVLPGIDQAKLKDQAALQAAASGPLLMQETLAVLEDIPDIPFAEICNDGSKVTSRNLLGKLARFTLTPIKEVYLPLMTWGLPTNFLMLTFRTFNRDFDLPNANDDYLAPLLRDSLMPARGKMHREKSAFLKWKTSLFDLPLVGLPGIVNFIDCRTQWFDAAVKSAIRAGITQVGGAVCCTRVLRVLRVSQALAQDGCGARLGHHTTRRQSAPAQPCQQQGLADIWHLVHSCSCNALQRLHRPFTCKQRHAQALVMTAVGMTAPCLHLLPLLQVVIIAAGYDTRAYRLASPGVRFYEVDLPHASQKKQELVAEHMPRDKVGVLVLRHWVS